MKGQLSRRTILRARNLDECGHICRMRKYDMVVIFSFHMKCYSMIGFVCVNFAFSYSSLKLMAILLSRNFPSHWYLSRCCLSRLDFTRDSTFKKSWITCFETTELFNSRDGSKCLMRALASMRAPLNFDEGDNFLGGGGGEKGAF